MRADIERLIELSRQLTRIEAELGVDVYAPQAFAFRGTNSRTHWEAAHQGYTVAEDERRRLDLGSAPIRDVPETLATLRVRISRLALPESVLCLYLHTPETGPLVIVNRNSSPEERRFWMVHGLAHLFFESERRWLICRRDDMGHRHEVRANAFASRFLMACKGSRALSPFDWPGHHGGEPRGRVGGLLRPGRGPQRPIAGPSERSIPPWELGIQHLRAVSGLLVTSA